MKEIFFKKSQILHKISGIRWQIPQGQQKKLREKQQNFQNAKGIYNFQVRIISTENIIQV